VSSGPATARAPSCGTSRRRRYPSTRPAAGSWPPPARPIRRANAAAARPYPGPPAAAWTGSWSLKLGEDASLAGPGFCPNSDTLGNRPPSQPLADPAASGRRGGPAHARLARAQRPGWRRGCAPASAPEGLLPRGLSAAVFAGHGFWRADSPRQVVLDTMGPGARRQLRASRGRPVPSPLAGRGAEIARPTSAGQARPD
jgi:hypothetical protein